MKRAALIGVGTLGGLGAVLSITPPQFGTDSSQLGASGASAIPAQSAAPAQTTTPAAPATKAAATKATTTKKKTTATKKATTATNSSSASTAKATAEPTPVATATPTPTPTKTTSAGYTGVVSGNTAQTRWGPVQVQLTISNGKITAAKALQYPNGDGRSASISSQAIPYLVSQTLAAQSANIQGVGGASYTSYGWYQSLMSALAKAGMK